MYPNEETYPTTESEKENLRLRSAESTVICDHFQEGNHHTLGQISRESHHPDDPKLPQNASSCLFARILLSPLLFLTEKNKQRTRPHLGRQGRHHLGGITNQPRVGKIQNPMGKARLPSIIFQGRTVFT